jgi:subtilisin family serine protease
MSGLEKFDSGLQAIFTSYRDVQRHGAENVGRIHPVVARGAGLYIYLTYDPPLAPIEALGFKTVSHTNERRAFGLVQLKDLEVLAAHPAVRRMEVGTKSKPHLDMSIPDIHANEVRTQSGSGFTGVTGAGVIVGIIDTGLDFRHPDFQTPTGGSRVLFLWDQGIEPRSTDEIPDETLLDGPPSYGAVYTQQNLTDEIALGANAPMHGNVFHRDCAAHGTHVGSTAAGSGREGKFKYAGVAPDADIIAVKYLNPEKDPVDSEGNEVPWEKRFRDAVFFILRTAAKLGKPVVINMSFGSSQGPHDGTTESEQFLNQQFPPDAIGRACVASAGNAGRVYLHCEVNVPAGDIEVVVPMVLQDDRKKFTDTDYCDSRDNTEECEVQFWYPAAATTTLRMAVEAPNESRSDFVSLPGSLEKVVGGKKKLEISHKRDDVTIDGVAINRCVITLTIKPEGKHHLTGRYNLVFKSVDAVKVEAWGDDFGEYQVMRFLHPALDEGEEMPPLSPLVDEHGIASVAGSKGVISVAAYSAEKKDDFEVHQLVDFSSHGDLLDYTFANPPVDKPDIAAPGYSIDAAKSGNSCRFNFANLGLKPYGYLNLDGTSMSSPHVTGTVALMLQLKPNLTFGDIKRILMENADKPDDIVTDAAEKKFRREFGAGRLNVKRVLDAVRALP